MNCVYLRDRQEGRLANGDNDVFGCAQLGYCTINGVPTDVPSCASCKKHIAIGDKDFAQRFEDTLRITDRDVRPTKALHNLLAGGSAFLLCGGPSSRYLPLEKLNQRGVFSLAVNNMAGHVRPNAFVCSDPPLKFHHGIWLDPTIMKFVPTVKIHRRRGRLKKKLNADTFGPLIVGDKQLTVSDVPNVWGYDRRVWMMPDDSFFAADGASWGNNDAGCKRTGGPKTMMTMLIALRLLYYLGARTIYLVGVDFFMDPAAGESGGYAFNQRRTAEMCPSNNAQFAVVNAWLSAMRMHGTFDRFGVDVFNCNPKSGLRAFDYVPFDTAVGSALENFPKEPFDLDGWYEKK